jgi:hypothetical protein
MTTICRALLLLLGTAIVAFSQATFTQCDINKDNVLNVIDAQDIVNEGLGTRAPNDDLTGDGTINVVDIQIVIDGILGIGCPRDLVTPTYAVTSFTLLNQAWISADIPSPGDLNVNGASSGRASVLNQNWISADIPSPGDLTVNGASSSRASVLNQNWISADIPSPGDLTVNGASSSRASILNLAWIPADIPSAGNLNFAAGLLVSVNNNATSGPLSLQRNPAVKVIAGGSSSTPVDLNSVNDGDGLIAGQTVRFRIYPPDTSVADSDFLLNGTALRIHAPFEVLVTAPANVSAFDIQAVMYAGDGRDWRLPGKHLLVLSDPGLTMNGHATHADGRPAASVAVGVRTNGLTAEYFRADSEFVSWRDLDRAPDKRGFVTAVNQPNPGAVFGPDPFGTGFSGAYAARFRGQILISEAGPHRFFLDASLGVRLMVDGNVLIDAPPGRYSPESEDDVTLTAGWHGIEIDSYHTAFNPNLQLFWRQPNSSREVVRPEALATDFPLPSVTDTNGSFHLESFPGILNPLEWFAIPADRQVRVVLDRSTSEERPIVQ